MTSIKDEIVPILRRLINDYEEPNMYQDSALVEYITDAVANLKLNWNHNYQVIEDNGELKIQSTIEDEDVEEGHKYLFALMAKLQLLDSTPNTSFRSGSLSVTRKNDTQKRLQNEINKAIRKIKMNQSVSFLITEFD